LRTAVAGRTVFISSQRLSTILVADRAIVLEDGRVVEDDAPRKLLGRGGAFSRLFGDEAVAA
jgi:ATP-binding cassette subfamily B protein